MELQQAQMDRAQAKETARQVLYWTALASTLLGALYLLGLAGKLIVNGSVHAVSSPGVQSISAIVALLWDAALVILFAAFRKQVVRGRRLFADLGMVFMVLACATSSVNWFVQLAIVPRLGSEAGDTLRTLLDVHNELSITYAMEHLGWGLFFGLAAMFAAIAITGGRLGTWVRGLLLASGVLSLVHFVGVAASSVLLSDMGYVAWGVLLPAATAVMAGSFRSAR